MLVVSAGLIIKGSFDPERSPTGGRTALRSCASRLRRVALRPGTRPSTSACCIPESYAPTLVPAAARSARHGWPYPLSVTIGHPDNRFATKLVLRPR